MLTDPQTITISSNARTLAQTDLTPASGIYTDVDNGLTLYVTQRVEKGGVRRSTVSLTTTKIAADPLTAVNQRVDDAVTISFKVPPSGFTKAEVAAKFAAVSTWLTASTNANLNKVLGGER
ncbi:coat protein [ssRNA phage Gerhypos.4_44]|uniref:Coat protein n=2 Tax=Leviviricetes TaxID=2842243 RepID=A0A8S5L294_9VIRU|nr:coat protein [ssRNA phage Gerhypos.4_44]QDH91109.1 MAG: hypothetical protein H4Bulk46757_000002 [Leviviridae sp.]DAD51611.1 TPA_asm: coat protein [ssRNA phage Gerhypos.4_44]